MPPISNDLDLENVVYEAGILLQQIQDYCGRRGNENARVRFPRGYLKTAYDHRLTLPTIHDSNLENNLSYALMTADLFWWLLTRTDLSGQAREMVIKETICVLARICEALTIRRGSPGLGRGTNFKNRTRRLETLGVVSSNLKAEVDWVWDIRNRSHLAGVGVSEYSVYNDDDLIRSFNAYRGLKSGIKNHYG